MSLCHIWFGVARSNRRGGGLPLWRSFFTGCISPAPASSCRTFSGLARIQNHCRSNCEIRRTPCRGSALLSAMIVCRTGSGNGFGRGPRTASCNPDSPCSRYCRTHFATTAVEIPISRATASCAIPSSRCNCTARRRTSTGYACNRCPPPLRVCPSLFFGLGELGREHPGSDAPVGISAFCFAFICNAPFTCRHVRSVTHFYSIFSRIIWSLGHMRGW